MLIPRIVYVAQLSSFTLDKWEELYRPVLKLIKNKCGLPRSTPTASLQHGYILGLKDLGREIIINQIAAFMYIINSQTLAATTALIRCRTAQINLAIPNSIFQYDLASLLMNKLYRMHNWRFNTIILAA